ncbi:hypothetical protein Agabi119p4_2139 [Agaricus bisporus var. burnettii]|uniref:rRNA-processing protein EFG1 n=1 Tax=Agaricus bisporus var. burnettii TaxID=192524 RepID=A0A8H7KJZ5_AGABI|nr:hypothetical protein Agabi119p4_2139 [Agaricus bisporus var. burnettii]
MAPIRTHDSRPQTSNSAGKFKHKKAPRQQRNLRKELDTESAAPGVSKIKSSLRQTRRLLAKDKLAADVRVETERRLKALEGELAQAEVANKERTMATRYHKIKFFERQKVTRKISQIQKQIASTEDDPTKEKLLRTLYERRVDLNYILHYPKLKKYISLFPPEIRKGEQPSTASAKDAAETAQGREEVRSWVRSCMEKGELSGEPERYEASIKSKRKDFDSSNMSSKTKPHRIQEESKKAIEEDDFFGNDDDDDKDS